VYFSWACSNAWTVTNPINGIYGDFAVHTAFRV